MTEFQKLSDFILSKLKNDLPRYILYHNIDHTLDVLQAAKAIALAENITDTDRRLLLTAALLHDAGFLEGRERHEARSCALALLYLPAYNYKPAEIELICAMIMATRLPQSPQNHLQAILCDADLDYLGRDDFFVLSNRLFLELCAEGIVKDEREWNREQANFMGSHFYHTRTSINLRQPAKENYIEFIKSKISNPIV